MSRSRFPVARSASRSESVQSSLMMRFSSRLMYAWVMRVIRLDLLAKIFSDQCNHTWRQGRF